MIDNLKGCFLVPSAKNADKRLWFIFHHEADGILALDVTTEHPDIPFRHFEGFSAREPRERTVLLGGPEQASSALIVLHNDRQAEGAHKINAGLHFISRRFVLVPGHPPRVTTADDAPSRIELVPDADFLISLGFRMWDMDTLELELADWQWNFLPADPSVLFHTARGERLARALRAIN